MRRTAFITLAASWGAMAFGQGLLDCIEPDVLHALLLQDQGTRPPAITATVPQELVPLKMPREFTWIGSSERAVARVNANADLIQVTAAWRSSLAPDAARSAAAAALKAAGWELRQPFGPAVVAFVSPETQSLAQPACRDGGLVNFTASAMDGATYVLFTIQRGNPGTTVCNQPARPMMTTGFEQYTPRLEMPPDPATGTAVRQQGSNTSSGGGSMSTGVEFMVKDSPGNVARHFEKQLAAQGWTSDSTYTGTTTAGSTWSRRDGTTLVVVSLRVTAMDGQRMAATLRINKQQ